jgi:hypothetical protein
MTRLFTGDYSTGDFSQWSRVLNPSLDGSPSLNGVNHPRKAAHSAEVLTEDPDSGFCARYELRAGETERSEVKGDTPCFAAEGTTRWYAWSWKFDQSFPNNRKELKWGLVTAFKAARVTPSYEEYGSAVLEFSWQDSTSPHYSQTANGYVGLSWNPQTEPTVGTIDPAGGYYGGVLVNIPLAQGEWHDFKARAYWKKDNTGTFQLWRDGVSQTFNAVQGFAGGTTFTGQTVCGGTGPAGVIFQQGIYRNTAATHTDIVYHRGFRMADTENSL